MKARAEGEVAANPLGESPLFFDYGNFPFLVRIFRRGFPLNCFCAFVLLLLCSPVQ